MTRPRFRLWFLAAAFVLVPLAEIMVLIQVGQVIGAWWTVGLLLLSGIVGSWLIRHEGARAWSALTQALATGRMPARELADGALILIGGTLMLAPGFITDVVGMLLILPLTRPAARSLLSQAVARRLLVAPLGATSSSAPRHDTRPGPGQQTVIQGEVIDEG